MTFYICGHCQRTEPENRLRCMKDKKYQSTRYYLWVFMNLKGEIKEGVGNGHETTSKC